VAAVYDGLPRLLCPHVLGRKSGRLRMFCYQFGGNSNSGPAVAPEAMGGWRCLAVEKLSRVRRELRGPLLPTPFRLSDHDVHALTQAGSCNPCRSRAATNTTGYTFRFEACRTVASAAMKRNGLVRHSCVGKQLEFRR
jgi:hypothetical protein